MEERRQFVRLDTRLDVNYTIVPSGAAQHTVTKDISGGGVCLFVDQLVPVGTRLQISMKLPDREQPVNFTGEVVWGEQYEVIGKTQRQRAVEVGVRFVEITPEDREVVMRCVILTLRPPHPVS